jgi:peroxiredoxin
VPISVVVQDAVGAVPVVDDANIWADGLGLTFPVLADVHGEFYPIWDPEDVLPIAFIIDRDRVITYAEAGGSDEEFETLVIEALEGP